MRRLAFCLLRTLTGLALLFVVACSTPPPVYTGTLPQVPRKWPVEKGKADDDESPGWNQMERLWQRALTQSPAAPADTASLLKIAFRRPHDEEIRWLSPVLALGFLEHETGSISYGIITVYGLQEGRWVALKSYSGPSLISCYFEPSPPMLIAPPGPGIRVIRTGWQ